MKEKSEIKLRKLLQDRDKIDEKIQKCKTEINRNKAHIPWIKETTSWIDDMIEGVGYSDW